MPTPQKRHEPRFEQGERLSAGKLNHLADLVAGILQARRSHGVNKPRNLWVKLNEDLAAGELLTSKNEAEATVWQKNVDGEYEETTRTETVVNWSAESFSEDQFLLIKWQDGEWQPEVGGGGGVFALGHAVAGSVDCPNGLLEIDTTSATWIPSSCGAAPGADSYGIITVEDRLGWFSTKWTGRAAAPYPNQTDIEDAVYLKVSYGYENADGYGCDGIWWLDFPVIPPECPTGS